MRKSSVLLGLTLSFVILLPALGRAQAAAPKVDDDFVHQTFGKDFTFVPDVGSMVGDLDGDGVDDIAIAARCKNPLLDEAEHNYEVVDPYYTFYGYGDPKVTMSFSSDDPSKRSLVVLIIHGAGPDGWHAAAPKAKFVVINLPYRTLTMRRMKMGKKTMEAIYTEEGNELHETSALYFDGKRYKYLPMGSSMED